MIAFLMLLVACLMSLAGVASADEPSMFRGSAWVCDTPEHYDEALVKQTGGGDMAALRSELANICIFVEDEDQDEFIPPFVSRLEENGGKTKVMFMVQEERRKAFLHRTVQQIRYRGWTATDKLQPRSEWLKFGN